MISVSHAQGCIEGRRVGGSGVSGICLLTAKQFCLSNSLRSQTAFPPYCANGLETISACSKSQVLIILNQ